MGSAFEALDGAVRAGGEQTWSRAYPSTDPAAFPAIARSAVHMARLDGTTVFLAVLGTLLDGLTARIAA
ncbi:hypothetical protein [Streptomyces sp. NPDC088757]|uniref:hypothetical protein n=1 Tax=Streptomyces sp. NPDC088757 TaxID=3365889 RepID=UPI00380B06F4